MAAGRGALRVVRPRSLRAEALLALAAAGALAVICNPDAVRYLTRTVAGDLGDPLYFALQLAWVTHALGSDPGRLWTTNAFLQAPDNLAFTDTVLGYAPLGLVLPAGQAGALAQLNLADLIATALAAVGGYALGRALGAGRVGALVVAAGFGYAPWRLEQIVHLNVYSTGGIALALALLARGNGWSLRRGWQPERMAPGWILTGWAVACWQLTMGFATGIWFAYSLAIAMLAWTAGWALAGRRRARLPGRVLAAHVAGGAAFALLAFALVQPYLRVIRDHPEAVAVRSEHGLQLYSPPWRGLLTAPSTSWVWGERQQGWRAQLSWPPEMVLSPGLVLLGLALVGVFVSIWPWRRRLALLLATLVLTALTIGTAGPDQGRLLYLPLFRHLPGWSALRTPGRLMVWVTLGLGLLAAGAVARCYQQLRRRWAGAARRGVEGGGSRRWRVPALAAALIGGVPAAAIVLEGAGGPPHQPVATSPVRLAALPGPVLLLPTDLIGDYHMMLWSTQGWPVLANGSSGFVPAQQAALRAEAASFPDPVSVAALRRRGVRTVVIVRSRTLAGPPQWRGAADRPITGLPLRRTDRGDAVVYDLLNPP